MSADPSTVDSEELECRVCRNGSDNEHPLYHPCKCSGSIGLVHQECLEQWLAHSKKDTCELCSSKYHFEPQYAENTPDVIPLGVLISSICKLSLFKCLPFILRIITAIIVWLVFVPIGTTCVYCICISRHNLITREFSWGLLKSHITNGIVLDAVIALSLLILVSFTDFLRFHWIPGPAADNNMRPQQPPIIPAHHVHINRRNVVMNNNHINNNNNNNNINVNNNNNLNNNAMHPRVVGAALDTPLNHRMPMANIDRRDDDSMTDNEYFHQRGGFYRHHGRGDAIDDTSIDGTRHGVRPVFPLMTSPIPSPTDDHVMKESGDEDVVMDHGDNAIEGNPTIKSNAMTRRSSSPSQHEKGTYIDVADSPVDNERKIEDNDLIDAHLILDESLKSDARSDRHYGSIILERGEYDATEAVVGHRDAWQEEDEEERDDGGLQVDIEVPMLPAALEDLVDDNMAAAGDEMMDLRPDLADGLPEVDAGEDVQEVGLEIRVALLDLLGIEGPVHLMFRNSLWLLGFCSLYLTSSAALPYIIGYKVLQLLRVADLAHMLREVRVVRFLLEVHRRSVEETTPLQLMDFICIGCGLFSVFVVVFVIHFTSTLAQKLKLSSLFATYYEVVKKLSVVVKVGILLIVRIFLLPLFLGSVILAVFAHVLLPFRWNEWVDFFALNCVGACSLAWVAGITFMLTMTISVLQLREVLHPDFLAKTIRPQEPHMDLINSLVHESGLLHMRRIAVSCLVYLMLMVLFLFVPVWLLYHSCRLLHISPTFDLRFWYVVPEVQVPLELLVLHVSFLAVLDKRKDFIGRLQHLWLVQLSSYMGATRYLIPLPLYGSAFQQTTTAAHSTIDPTNNNNRINENPLPPPPRVGRPLRRPPAGWDLRAPQQSTRWAWGNEEPSSLERFVAPRVVPKHWFGLLAIMMLQSWALLICITMVILVVPLNVGRVLLQFSLFPSQLSHDPLCFVLGSVACLCAAVLLVRMAQRVFYTHYLTSVIRGLKVNVALQGLRILGLQFVVQSSLGFVCMTQLLDSSSLLDATWKDAHLLQMRWLSAAMLVSLKTAVFGSLLSTAAIHALTHDRWRSAVEAMHLDANLLDFVRLMRRMQMDVQLALTNRNYSREALQLNEFEHIIHHTLLPTFVYQGSIPVVVFGYAIACARELRGVGMVGIDVLLHNMRIVSTLLVLLRIAQVLYRPAVHWLGVFYSKIRNDRYLIGRTLINKTSQSSHVNRS